MKRLQLQGKEGREVTLREVIQTGLIKDTDPIRVRKITYADIEMIKSGNWFSDNILEEMEEDFGRRKQ